MTTPQIVKLTVIQKVLIICAHGNSRSVALGWILKQHFDMNVICCGAIENLQDKTTANMLLAWADVIILVDERLIHSIEEYFRQKLLICHVGDDIYFRGFNDGLLNQFATFLSEHGLNWQRNLNRLRDGSTVALQEYIFHILQVRGMNEGDARLIALSSLDQSTSDLEKFLASYGIILSFEAYSPGY